MVDGGVSPAPAAVEVDVEYGLTTADLKKCRPAVVASIYADRPKKCQQCGVRYLESEQKQFDDHLDWHFRDNQAKTKTAHSLFRGWQYTLDLWLQFSSARDDVIDDVGSSVFDDATSAADSATATALATSTRVLDGEKGACCAVCSEEIKQFYDDDEEEWKFKGALRVEGVLYDAMCYTRERERKQKEAASAKKRAAGGGGGGGGGSEEAQKRAVSDAAPADDAIGAPSSKKQRI
jgi:pre-mRNA cleavage complex 2 protein Pcf11